MFLPLLFVLDCGAGRFGNGDPLVGHPFGVFLVGSGLAITRSLSTSGLLLSAFGVLVMMIQPSVATVQKKMDQACGEIPKGAMLAKLLSGSMFYGLFDVWRKKCARQAPKVGQRYSDVQCMPIGGRTPVAISSLVKQKGLLVLMFGSCT